MAALSQLSYSPTELVGGRIVYRRALTVLWSRKPQLDRLLGADLAVELQKVVALELVAVGRDQVDFVDSVPRSYVAERGAPCRPEGNDDDLSFAPSRLALDAVDGARDLEDEVRPRVLRERFEDRHAETDSLVSDCRLRYGSFVIRRLDHHILSVDDSRKWHPKSRVSDVFAVEPHKQYG
jgi:hypothetical protein